MRKISELSTEELVEFIASSDGDINLACERIDTSLGNSYGTTNEYELRQRISALDIASADNLIGRFRTLLAVKLYWLIGQSSLMMAEALTSLKPADLVKTHAAMVNSFTMLTAPSAKVTFDFNGEIERLAQEFNLPIEEVKGTYNEMEKRVKERK